MTTSSESEGIVLRTRDLGEADLIVELITPGRGRVAAIAKHARKSVKRFPGSLDLFNHLTVELRPHRNGGMPLMLRARLISPFLPLRRDLARYGLGCYLAELLGRLAPEHGAGPEMRRIFDFTLDALGALSECSPDRRLRVLFEICALDVLGLRPELRHCVRCGTEVAGPLPVAFHVGDGGVVCGRCAVSNEHALYVHLGTLRTLEQALHTPMGKLHRLHLARGALEEAQHLVARFQRHHVGIALRSERFLGDVLAPPASA